MKFDQKKNFRTVWNQFKADAVANTPKNITKEYAFILQVNYVLGRAFKASIEVSDQRAVEKALTDMDNKGIKLNFAGLMMHKTIFE
jgi:hypothetical protein